MSSPDCPQNAGRADHTAPDTARIAVVKLGGSLAADPLLVDWLRALTTLGAGRVVIVPGGGVFADGVRAAQQRWGFNDLAAHNMAVLAMAQFAHQLQALAPETTLATGAEALRRVLHGGGTAVWLPLDALRSDVDDTTAWDATSDTLAALLARQLRADSLLLVKACAVDPAASLADLARAGIVDRRFPIACEGAGCRVLVLNRHALPMLHGWLEVEVEVRASGGR